MSNKHCLSWQPVPVIPESDHPFYGRSRFHGFHSGSGLCGPNFHRYGTAPEKRVAPSLWLPTVIYYGICGMYHHRKEIPWSLSTQGYINSAAFATGLCPIVGRYGIRAGIAAGFMCASLCTSTSALHGGLILYNGGFTTGITALILLPILEHYIPKARTEMKNLTINMRDMLTLIGNNLDI